MRKDDHVPHNWKSNIYYLPQKPIVCTGCVQDAALTLLNFSCVTVIGHEKCAAIYTQEIVSKVQATKKNIKIWRIRKTVENKKRSNNFGSKSGRRPSTAAPRDMPSQILHWSNFTCWHNFFCSKILRVWSTTLSDYMIMIYQARFRSFNTTTSQISRHVFKLLYELAKKFCWHI